MYISPSLSANIYALCASSMTVFVLKFAYATYGFTFAFIGLAVQYQMVDVHGFTPAESATAWGLVSVPWTLKPIYGMVMDRIGKRVLISPAAFLCGCALAYLPNIHTKSGIVAGLTFISFLLCISDVGTDCIVVEHAKKEEVEGALQSSCWAWRSFGSLIATGLSGGAYTYLGYNATLYISSICPLLLGLLIWELNESDSKAAPIMTGLKAYFNMWDMIIFVVVIGLLPECNTIFFYYLEPRLDPIELSIASVAGSLAACVVAQFSLPYMNSLKASIILNSMGLILAFCMLLGAPPFGTQMVRDVFGGIAGMLFTLPMVIRAAKMCPSGGEGVTYALFVSTMNLSGIVGEWIESVAVAHIGITKENMSDMGLFLLICICSSCLPCYFLPLLKR